MTFLPIVERELRVASRRRSTFRIRTLSAFVAMIVTAVLLASWGLGSSGTTNKGQLLFQILAWMSFVGVCFAGVFLTSDSLSEERREGTLGLLFLTNLRGHDVVLGKLLATSLQAFYGMLAVFPILGLPLLIGGVTGMQFWKVLLILVNALFFSLSVGIFVSSFSRDSLRAMGTTFGILFITLVLLPTLELRLFNTILSGYPAVLGFVSPTSSLIQIWNANYGGFAANMLTVTVLGLGFIVVSSVLTPRLWQQKRPTATSAKPSFWTRWTKTPSIPTDGNPIAWIAQRSTAAARIRLLVVAILILEVALFAAGMQYTTLLTFSSPLRFGVSLLLKLAIASQAVAFFCEGRRSGALELLLCTPISADDVIKGQWLALKKNFLWPMGLMSGLALFPFVLTMVGTTGGDPAMIAMQVTRGLSGIVALFTVAAALSWYGMWAGLTTQKPGLAVLKAVALVVVVPWFVSAFSQGFIFFFLGMLVFRNSGMSLYWLAPVLSTIAIVIAHLCFVAWSRKQLSTRLRIIAAGVDKPRRNSLANPPPVTH